MSVDQPSHGGTPATGDSSTPARKSDRLQSKRKVVESPAEESDLPLTTEANKGRKENVMKTRSPKRIKIVHVKASEEVVNQEDEADETTSLSTSEIHEPQLLPSGFSYYSKAERLKLINDHCITDLTKASQATTNKAQQVLGKGHNVKTIKVVQRKEVEKEIGEFETQGTTSPQFVLKSSIPTTIQTQPQISSTKSLLKPSIKKPIQAVAQDKADPKSLSAMTDGSEMSKKPESSKIRVKVYASAQKTFQLGANEQPPKPLQKKDALGLVSSMQEVLKALAKHTFTEEMFECAIAVVKPDEAVMFRENPELIQQICGLTAVSLVDVTDSMFLFGPVSGLHKTKVLMEKMKEKGYVKIDSSESQNFVKSSLQLICDLQPPQEREKSPEKPAHNPLNNAPVFQGSQEIEEDVEQPPSEEMEEEEETADETFDETVMEEVLEGEVTEASEEQSLAHAVLESVDEVPGQIVIKMEDTSFMDAEMTPQEVVEEEGDSKPREDVEYACDMCCVSFDSKDVFYQHTEKVYHQSSYKKWIDEYPYQCDQCLKRCKDPRAILIHQPQCQNQRLFRRIVNGRISIRDVDMDTSNVIRLKRSTVNKWQSENPDMEGEILDDLVYEEDVAHTIKDEADDFDPDDNENNLEDVKKKKQRFLGNSSDNITCMHCDKIIARSAFESHCVYHHSGWTYTCPLCTRQANRRGAMLRHLLSSHKNEWSEGEVEVTIQGNISNTPVHTKVYMTGPHRTDYQCAHCSCSFNDPSECAHHTFKQHVPKQFVCAWCGKHFGALHHLTFHSAAVHGRVMVADQTGSYTIEKTIDELLKKDFLCNVCGELYRSKLRHDKVCMKGKHSNKRIINTTHPEITQEMVDRFPDAFKFIHECDQCGYMTTAKGLISHRKFLHFHNSLYACRLCPLFGNTIEIMEAHLKRKHFRSKQFREGLECTILDEMPKDVNPDHGIVICVNSTCIRLPPSVKIHDYYELLYNRKEGVDYTTNDECDQCGFKGKAHIVQFHKKNVHGPVAEVCPLCRKPMREEGILSRHIAIEHFEDGHLVYSTRHQPKKREDLIRDRAVLTNYEDVMVQCPTCNKMIKSNYMRQHEKIHVKNATCDICSASFRCRAELKKHLVRKHTPQELVCRQCDISFQTTQHLENHMQVAHDNQKKYTCPHCPTAVFDAMRYLKAHMQRKHENPHRFSCAHCGKRFYEKCKRDQHMRIHLPDNAVGRYRAHCRVCNKHFKSERYLETHMNLHTKSTLYACTVCHRQFSLLSTLRKHQLLHNDEQPYPCDHPGCTKTFKTATKLKYHKVVHTKDSPYVCGSCDKVFTQPWTLKKHVCKFEKEEEQVPQLTQTLFPQSGSTESPDNLTMVLQQNGQIIQTETGALMEGMDNASGEAIMTASHDQHMIPKQEHVEEGDTTYQCAQCSYAVDTLEAAMEHVETHKEGEVALPTSLPLAEAGMEHVSFEEAGQQIQVQDLDGNQHYITLKLDGSEDQVIQLDENTFVSYNQQ